MLAANCAYGAREPCILLCFSERFPAPNLCHKLLFFVRANSFGSPGGPIVIELIRGARNVALNSAFTAPDFHRNFPLRGPFLF